METFSLRNHFAVRFGRGVAEDQALTREGQVRQAFNSPFWPFVLSSTSVGQEGLDFHQYSHAIVHWNLPSNPVDLEQREGRVHRYKGHAVRRNIAQRTATAPRSARRTTLGRQTSCWRPGTVLRARPGPPLLGVPARGRPPDRALRPALPLSRELHAYKRLMRTVGAYRLVHRAAAAGGPAALPRR